MTRDQAHQVVQLLIRINTTLDLISHLLEEAGRGRGPAGYRIPEPD